MGADGFCRRLQCTTKRWGKPFPYIFNSVRHFGTCKLIVASLWTDNTSSTASGKCREWKRHTAARLISKLDTRVIANDHACKERRTRHEDTSHFCLSSVHLLLFLSSFSLFRIYLFFRNHDKCAPIDAHFIDIMLIFRLTTNGIIGSVTHPQFQKHQTHLRAWFTRKRHGWNTHTPSWGNLQRRKPYELFELSTLNGTSRRYPAGHGVVPRHYHPELSPASSSSSSGGSYSSGAWT